MPLPDYPDAEELRARLRSMPGVDPRVGAGVNGPPQPSPAEALRARFQQYGTAPNPRLTTPVVGPPQVSPADILRSRLQQIPGTPDPRLAEPFTGPRQNYAAGAPTAGPAAAAAESGPGAIRQWLNSRFATPGAQTPGEAVRGAMDAGKRAAQGAGNVAGQAVGKLNAGGVLTGVGRGLGAVQAGMGINEAMNNGLTSGAVDNTLLGAATAINPGLGAIGNLARVGRDVALEQGVNRAYRDQTAGPELNKALAGRTPAQYLADRQQAQAQPITTMSDAEAFKNLPAKDMELMMADFQRSGRPQAQFSATGNTTPGTGVPLNQPADTAAALPARVGGKQQVAKLQVLDEQGGGAGKPGGAAARRAQAQAPEQVEGDERGNLDAHQVPGEMWKKKMPDYKNLAEYYADSTRPQRVAVSSRSRLTGNQAPDMIFPDPSGKQEWTVKNKDGTYSNHWVRNFDELPKNVQDYIGTPETSREYFSQTNKDAPLSVSQGHTNPEDRGKHQYQIIGPDGEARYLWAKNDKELPEDAQRALRNQPPGSGGFVETIYGAQRQLPAYAQGDFGNALPQGYEMQANELPQHTIQRYQAERASTQAVQEPISRNEPVSTDAIKNYYLTHGLDPKELLRDETALQGEKIRAGSNEAVANIRAGETKYKTDTEAGLAREGAKDKLKDKRFTHMKKIYDQNGFPVGEEPVTVDIETGKTIGGAEKTYATPSPASVERLKKKGKDAAEVQLFESRYGPGSAAQYLQTEAKPKGYAKGGLIRGYAQGGMVEKDNNPVAPQPLAPQQAERVPTLFTPQELAQKDAITQFIPPDDGRTYFNDPRTGAIMASAAESPPTDYEAGETAEEYALRINSGFAAPSTSFSADPGLGRNDPGLGRNNPGLGRSDLGFGRNDPGFGQALSGSGPIDKARNAYAQGGPIAQMSQGRQIQGPGTGTSDSVPALIDGKTPAAISDGEYVIPTAVVKRVGTKFLDDLIAKNQAGAVNKPASARR